MIYADDVKTGDKLVFQASVEGTDGFGKVLVCFPDLPYGHGVWIDPSLAISHIKAERPFERGDPVIITDLKSRIDDAAQYSFMMEAASPFNECVVWSDQGGLQVVKKCFVRRK